MRLETYAFKTIAAHYSMTASEPTRDKLAAWTLWTMRGTWFASHFGQTFADACIRLGRT